MQFNDVVAGIDVDLLWQSLECLAVKNWLGVPRVEHEGIIARKHMCKMSISSNSSGHFHRRIYITRLADHKHVYLCTPVGPAAGNKASVAKLAASAYPWELHRELSQIGLAPGLTAPLRKWPGGVEVVYMEFLDPAHGWVPLRGFSGDWTALEKLLRQPLRSCISA